MKGVSIFFSRLLSRVSSYWIDLVVCLKLKLNYKFYNVQSFIKYRYMKNLINQAIN